MLERMARDTSFPKTSSLRLIGDRSMLAMVPRSFSPVIASMPSPMAPANSIKVIKYGRSIVITSYSIHYTKLYEKSSGGSARSDTDGTAGDEKYTASQRGKADKR